MREYDLAAGVRADGAGGDHVAGGARGFVRPVHHGLRQRRVDEFEVVVVHRVHENHGASFVQMIPYRLQIGGAEIQIAVAREDRNAVGFELVQRKVDLGNGELRVD